MIKATLLLIELFKSKIVPLLLDTIKIINMDQTSKSVFLMKTQLNNKKKFNTRFAFYVVTNFLMNSNTYSIYKLLNNNCLLTNTDTVFLLDGIQLN